MIITCPQCDTSFSIPDEVYRPGRKARCSRCTHVFAMPDIDQSEHIVATAPTPNGPSPDTTTVDSPLPSPTAGKKKKRIFLLVALLLCLLGLGAGGFMVFKAYQGQQEEKLAQMVKARRQARDEEAAKRREQDLGVRAIELADVRQTLVQNEKLGTLVVVEGYAVNQFSEPRAKIAVEVLLLDKSGQVIAKTTQLCGISLTLVQLEVLSLEELERALQNPVDILANNSYVRKGERVPFVVVFQGVPKNLATYEVRPVEASIPSAQPE